MAHDLNLGACFYDLGYPATAFWRYQWINGRRTLKPIASVY
jgi:hypothetical protein